MKPRYQIVLSVTLFILIIIILFTGLEPLLKNLIILNLVALILRKPIILFIDYLTKKQVFRVVGSAGVNMVWSVFLFWLIFAISTDFFIALLSFFLVTISFTLRTIINNIAAGALMLTTEQFEIGDLIETNNIQE